LTTLHGTVQVPVVTTTQVPGKTVVKVEPTSAALPPITSVFTDAGTFTEGTTKVVAQDNGCKSDDYPTEWRITPDGAAKIQDGEKEHCADFQYAFGISLQRYAAAVNQLAQSGREFPNQPAAVAFITNLVGAKPADWEGIFLCLAGKTKLRDATWHTPRPRRIPPSLDSGCKAERVIVSASSLPEIGQHPPAEIIAGCGEAGPGPGRGGKAK
jgi:hypothetical protein